MLSGISQLEKDRGSREVQSARQAVLRWKFADQQHEAIEEEAKRGAGVSSAWADAMLLVLADRQNISPEAREAARRTIDAGWNDPARQSQILRGIALAEHRNSKEKVLQAAASSNETVAGAAREAARALRIEKELENAKPSMPEKTIGDLNIPEVITAVQSLKGDLKLGEELFTRQGCVNCHTTAADQPLRGPFLGNIANTYKRAELAEAILVPSKSIAQGFVAHQFTLKDGEEHEGFVIQEAADKVIIRNVAAQEITIPIGDVASRKKVEKSLMPEGLAANLTPKELASLLDYLQALAK
jgi:putative heme-binding domain-containing protein